MKCGKCKQDLPPQSKFCSYCGAPQTVPGKPDKSSPKPQTASVFSWVFAAIVITAVIIAVGANSGTTTRQAVPVAKSLPPTDYEDELQKFAKAIDVGDVGGMVGAAERLKNPPTEELGRRYVQLLERGGLEYAKRRSAQISDEDIDVQNKLDRFLELRGQISTLFRPSRESGEILEEGVLAIVAPLPEAMLNENAAGYRTLSRISPSNQTYSSKAAAYDAKVRAAEEAALKLAQQAKEARARAILAKYRVEEDKFNETKFFTHPNSPRYANSRSTVYLYMARTSGRYFLRMKTQYAASDWLFVENVLGYANGDSFTLTSGDFDRDHNSEVWEWLDERPSDNQLLSLKRLAQAPDATLRFVGSTYRKDVPFSSADKKAILAVLEDYKELNELE